MYLYLLLCFLDLTFMTCMLAFDKISWQQMDLCWNVPTLGKFSEKFPCKVTIHSCPENGATHDLLYVERPRKILCCNCNGFLKQKGSNIFCKISQFVTAGASYFYYKRESYHIDQVNFELGTTQRGTNCTCDFLLGISLQFMETIDKQGLEVVFRSQSLPSRGS